MITKSPYTSISNLQQAYDDLQTDQDKLLDVFDINNKQHVRLLKETVKLQKEIEDLINEFEDYIEEENK